jgi:TRAP-type C4-dicarboxylate transport system substrate-binding protein
VFEKAMKIIEAKSNKGITFQYFPGDQLLKPTETAEAMRKNVIQVAVTDSQYEMDRFGILGDVATAPFSWDADKWHSHWRDPGSFFDFAEPIWNKNKLHYLAAPRVTAELHSKKPIHKLEDFKGKLIRASGSMLEVLKMLGAEPTFIPLSEVYEAIERGVIDGSCTSISDYSGSKRYEVAKYLTISGIYTGKMDHAMNLEVYNSMPKEWQKIIDNAFIEAEQWWAKTGLPEENKEIFDILKKNKVEIYYLPDEERARWKKATMPFWDGMAKKYPNDYPRLKTIVDKLSR